MSINSTNLVEFYLADPEISKFRIIIIIILVKTISFTLRENLIIFDTKCNITQKLLV